MNKDYSDYKLGAIIFFFIMGSIGLILKSESNAIYLLAFVSFCFIFYGFYKLYRYYKIANWVSTKVVVDSFNVIEKKSPSEFGEDNCYYPNIEYHFYVDNVKNNSSTVALEKKDICFNYKSDAQKLIDNLLSTASVFYDPKQPNNCSLIRNITKKSFVHYISMLLVGILLGVSLLIIGK